jgi:hypothetical protein
VSKFRWPEGKNRGWTLISKPRARFSLAYFQLFFKNIDLAAPQEPVRAAESMAFGQDGACGLPLQLAAWQSLAAEWGGAKKNDPIFSEGVVAASETCYFDAAL